MDQDPYRATPPFPGQPADSWVIEIPGSITRPIKYMWLMLAVLSVISFAAALLMLFAIQGHGTFIAAGLGLTTCMYVPLAVGIYKRLPLVAVGTLIISVIGLLGAFVRAAMGDVSVPALVVSAVMTLISVRGTIAIYAFHRLVAEARRRPPGQESGNHTAPAGKPEA
ncbi:hypothetical protein [Stenotrophomonas sp. S41]|uniref:hypothetical protein n=1 Tax=Stenotrophomonas sp. S41 TaxID=2767464 RepID=UPI001909D502|nr:hypothetical protein [Stenotrophomonas sp. S41]MBK0013672.1 hypothetical protein [Stenotrophomonas sp. S41]